MQTQPHIITNPPARLCLPHPAETHGAAPQPPTPNPQLPAFSIIELLVAISVLSLMMTLAARIFFDAQAGVQRGMQTSQIIAESRSISQPLTKDVRSMNVFESKYGSNSPGFLIIQQNAFDGVLYPDPDDITDDTSVWTVDRDGDGTPNETADINDDDMMRSDQIGFFIDANNLESLTPGENSRYDSDARARHARVWYGHAWPADVTPSPAATDDQPGRDGYNLASQLILGRQALLLVENDAATTYPGGRYGDNTGTGVAGRVAQGGGTLGDVRANTYLGEFDVLNLNTFARGPSFTLYDDGGVDPAGGPNGLFRTPTYDEPSLANRSWFGDAVGIGSLDGSTGLPNTAYRDRVLEWLYTTPGQRIRAATSIDTDFTASGTGGIFAADTIAQLHAAFAPHVADFAIEIAADWIDGDPSIAPGNPGAPDGQPDFEPDRDGFGNIKWYTLIRPNPDMNDNGVGDNFPTEPVTYDASLVNPALFNGTVGDLSGNPFVYGTTFVFSHTGDDVETDETTTPIGPPKIEGCGKYWPYMIRFRYRLMDGRGEFRTISINPDSNNDGTADDPTEYSVVGRWFEQIVPVPRPQGLY